ncbi:MAG TPA: alpha/beta fold hydrolase [Gemmataceae bacterium]|nr:alpha/beta fold hydrolase [Gemmataceae bacterium]
MARDIVVLVHGFFRGPRDMHRLARHLSAAGYEIVAPRLPTTFGTLADCSERLAVAVDALPREPGRTLHFVSHSMGGLVIRHYLAQHVVPGLGRCVFIAPPNAGSALADLWRRWRLLSPVRIVRGLDCLCTDAPAIPVPAGGAAPEIGIIAGNRNNLLFGKLCLPAESDGRVTVAAARCEGLTDFLTVPLGHRQIHHDADIARQVEHFLRTGRFDSGRSSQNSAAGQRFV